MATPAACVVECWLEIKLQATNQSKILIAPSALLFLSQPEQPGARIMDLAVLGSLLIASQDPLSACSTAVRRFSRRAFSRIQMSLESMRGTKLIIPDSGHRPGGDHIETTLRTSSGCVSVVSTAFGTIGTGEQSLQKEVQFCWSLSGVSRSSPSIITTIYSTLLIIP